MGEVKISVKVTIESERMTATEIWQDGEHVWLRQDGNAILIATAAVPALIEALQAAAKEASDE